MDGRYRFTSVLVGLPVEQYKTEYAFRGYAVLSKNGKDVTVYGPVRASSIYTLAQLLLERGSYQPGTDAYKFLEKLINSFSVYPPAPVVVSFPLSSVEMPVLYRIPDLPVIRMENPWYVNRFAISG